MTKKKINGIYQQLNNFIFKNSDKISVIFGFVKLFNESKISDNIDTFFDNRIKEIQTHFLKSTNSKNVYDRTLGDVKSNLAAEILEGFDLTLYNCKFIDINTGHCIKDIDTTLPTKDNDYFNFLMDMCSILITNYTDTEKLNIMQTMLDDIYMQHIEKNKNCKDVPCTISKKYHKI